MKTAIKFFCSFLFILSLFSCAPKFSSETLNEIRYQGTGMDFYVDFDCALVMNMDEYDFYDFDKAWYETKSACSDQICYGINRWTSKKGIIVGGRRNTEYELYVSVLTIDKNGDMTARVTIRSQNTTICEANGRFKGKGSSSGRHNSIKAFNTSVKNAAFNVGNSIGHELSRAL